MIRCSSIVPAATHQADFLLAIVQLLRLAWHHHDPLALHALAVNHTQHAMRQHTARTPGAVPYRLLAPPAPAMRQRKLAKRVRDDSPPPRVLPPRHTAPPARLAEAYQERSTSLAPPTHAPATRNALRSITKDLLDTLEWQAHRVADWYVVPCVCGDEPVEVLVGPDGSCVARHGGVFKTCNRVEAEVVPAAKNWKVLYNFACCTMHQWYTCATEIVQGHRGRAACAVWHVVGKARAGRRGVLVDECVRVSYTAQRRARQPRTNDDASVYNSRGGVYCCCLGPITGCSSYVCNAPCALSGSAQLDIVARTAAASVGLAPPMVCSHRWCLSRANAVMRLSAVVGCGTCSTYSVGSANNDHPLACS